VFVCVCECMCVCVRVRAHVCMCVIMCLWVCGRNTPARLIATSALPFFSFCFKSALSLLSLLFMLVYLLFRSPRPIFRHRTTAFLFIRSSTFNQVIQTSQTVGWCPAVSNIMRPFILYHSVLIQNPKHFYCVGRRFRSSRTERTQREALFRKVWYRRHEKEAMPFCWNWCSCFLFRCSWFQ